MNSCQRSIVNNKKRIKGYTALGSGVGEFNDRVWSIYALNENQVYIGGNFRSAGGNTNIEDITMWNGKNFTALGSGVNNTVYAIYALDSEHVYIGGSFTSAGGNTTIKYITMWNGNTFTKLGDGNGVTNAVYAIYALDENHIYIGGTFQYITM